MPYSKHNPSNKELLMFKEIGMEFIHNENSFQVYYECGAKVLTNDDTPDWVRTSVKSALKLLLSKPNINTSSDEFQNCIDEVVLLPTHKKCVHTEHCCIIHGCKYGDNDCVVENGVYAQSFPCESCHNPYYDGDVPYKPIIVTKKMLEEIQQRKDDRDNEDLFNELFGDEQ